MNKIMPDTCHKYILRNSKKLLAFDDNAEFGVWRHEVKLKLTELLGDMPEEKCPLNIEIEYRKEHTDYTEIRFYFDSEPYACVPCHLLIPRGIKKKYPLVICLQGHSTGMHISLGDNQGCALDGQYLSEPDMDYAIEAVNEGYAALAIEQRGFGERISPQFMRKFNRHTGTSCQPIAMNALLLGRTLLGERVWDISRAIDAMDYFPEIDTDRIGCMGNSGGGTATYYAACMDERIKVAMPSCSVCTFEESIGRLFHCDCNYIPKMAKYFDMGDIACLIAPRKLVVIGGKVDDGFKIKGVLDAYSTIEKIYDKAGCKENCTLIVGNGGHRFYADEGWKAFDKLAGWK